jgi:hypothetical protein
MDDANALLVEFLIFSLLPIQNVPQAVPLKRKSNIKHLIINIYW